MIALNRGAARAAQTTLTLTVPKLIIILSNAENSGGAMTRVVLVGFEPETVDFSDPALPPGMTAEKVSAGIAFALKQMRERGWEADACLVRRDETAGPAVERHLCCRKL